MYYRKRRSYIGDFVEDDIKSPKRAKLMWKVAKETIERKTKKIRYLQLKTARQMKKIKTLQSLIEHLKHTKRISDDYLILLQVLLISVFNIT